MRRFIVGATAIAFMAALIPAGRGQQKGLSPLMVDKLRHSQSLLHGIAVSDFNKITNSAEELINLSKREEWLAHKTPRYEVHSNDFVRAAETVIAKSKAKNLDGVVLAYMDLTMSCVRCHQYLREMRETRGPSLNGPTFLARRE